MDEIILGKIQNVGTIESGRISSVGRITSGKIRSVGEMEFPVPPDTIPVFAGVSMYSWELGGALGSPDLTSWPGSQGGATISPPISTNAPQVTSTAVVFDGIDDFLRSTTSLTWSSQYHIFIVASNGAGAGGATDVLLSSEATLNAVRLYYNRGAVRMDTTLWMTNASVVVPTSTYPVGGETVPALFELDVDAATCRMLTDGVAGSSVAMAAAARNTTQVLHVGARTDTPSDVSSANIRAIAIYMANLTSDQQTSVRNYLNLKYLP